MLMSVLGMDPSLLHWGLASADIDLTSGVLTTPDLELIEPMELSGKQIRVNSNDLYRAEQLATRVFYRARKAKVIFVEVPVGSQSARAMASYGVCIGILGSLRAEGIQIIEVTATETKVALTGNKNASKQNMIDAAVAAYPDANWPRYTRNGAKFKKGDIMNTAEHVADAVATIHSGVNTPVFQNLMRLYL